MQYTYSHWNYYHVCTLCRKVNDGNFGWRALRLLARRSPHFFVHGNYPINKLPEYLETMIKKIAKDRPVSNNYFLINILNFVTTFI